MTLPEKQAALFAEFDNNDDGNIDRTEFSSLYNTIEQHVRKEHGNERESAVKIATTQRRAKAFAVLFVACFMLLAARCKLSVLI